MRTYTFKFKINAPEYAKRFGVVIPDDSMDDQLTDDGETQDGIVAEDANVEVDNSLLTSAQKACKTPLEQCRAKNPMTCRYHGAIAIANDIEAQLRASGLNGKVNVNLLGVSGNTLSVQASITAGEKEEEAVQQAMAGFFQLPGVEGDAKDFMYDDVDNSVGSIFDIDMLDPGAKAKWGMGETPLGGTATPQTASANTATQATPTQTAPTSASTANESVSQTQAPQPPVQPTSAASSSIPPSTPRKRPTRKRTGAAVLKPTETTEKVASKESPKESPEQPSDKKADRDTLSQFVDDDDAPTLFPGEKSNEPPKWERTFTDAELDSIVAMAERIGKTAETIDKHLDKGDMDAYLAKKGGNGVLPDRLQKYKNQIGLATLEELAKRDTQGQVQKLVDACKKINASEANGWMDKIGVTKSDLSIDRSKYDDPYAAERAAFEAYVPGSKGREDALKGLEQIDKSSAKDAPKSEANACREAAKQMGDLEDAFAALKGMSDVFKNAFGRAYYKANEAFAKGLKACQEWKNKQSWMRSTIADTIAGFKERKQKVPEELINWQRIEDRYENQAWNAIADRLGFDRSKKSEHMAFYKKNMTAYLTRCPIVSSLNFEHVRLLQRGETLHGNTNSYVDASNAGFGTNWARYSKAANEGMHLYASVHNQPFCELDSSKLYWRGGTGVLLNPKKAIISFQNKYMDSKYAVEGHYNGCNPTFAKNPTCTGVSYAGGAPYGSGYGKIDKAPFQKDISELPMDQLQKKMGFTYKSGEAWGVGGITAEQTLAVRDFNSEYSDSDVKKFNAKGITVLDAYGHLRGENLIPDDPELQELVWGYSRTVKK